MLKKDLYTVNYQDEQKAIITLHDETHPLFKAHFPSMPILPGFMNFDIVESLFNMKITIVKKAKFLKTIGPNQTITYEKTIINFKFFFKDKLEESFI